MVVVSYDIYPHAIPIHFPAMLTHGNAGESHSALILLYRAIDLPTAEEVKETSEDVPMQES